MLKLTLTLTSTSQHYEYRNGGADDDCTDTEECVADTGAEPNRGEHTKDWPGTADRARRDTDTDERTVCLLAAHDATPKIDSMIGIASSGARTSSATPRVSTVIAKWKN